MFYLDVGYFWDVLEDVDVDGAIFRASGIDMPSALRRDHERPSDVLFDPQLYLSDYDLDPDLHESLVLRLCMYEWFGASPPTFDSAASTRREYRNALRDQLPELWSERTDPNQNWQEAVDAALDFQRNFQATGLILPSPLIRDPEDDLSRFFERLDDGLASAPDDAPLYVTVALDEGAIAHRDPTSNDLVESLADGLTARPEIERVYLVLTSEASPHVQIVNPNVVGSFLRLVSMLSSLEVVVNFVECLGIASLGFGATGYCASFYTKGRNLRISDYIARGGGAAYPRFHSANLALDFDPTDDVQRLRDRRLLHYLNDDWTTASDNLRGALQQGLSVADVADWRKARNNTKASRKHFAQVHTRMGNMDWTPDSVFQWVQGAEAAWIYLSDLFENNPLSVPDGLHLRPWRNAVESLL